MSMTEGRGNAYLREAEAEDIALLFRWANEKEVRDNSFSGSAISWEEHRKWFECVLRSDEIRQYIFVVGGADVGQIRIRREGDAAEISYSIASEYRRMGYAKRMVSCLMREVRENFPEICRLTAQVKPGNIASRRVFADLGYTEKCRVYELALL